MEELTIHVMEKLSFILFFDYAIRNDNLCILFLDTKVTTLRNY